jgi:hypothetical protein
MPSRASRRVARPGPEPCAVHEPVSSQTSPDPIQASRRGLAVGRGPFVGNARHFGIVRRTFPDSQCLDGGVSRIISFSIRFFLVNATLMIRLPCPFRSAAKSAITNNHAFRSYLSGLGLAAVPVNCRPERTISVVTDCPTAVDEDKAEALGFGPCNLGPRLITSVQHCDLSQILQSVRCEPARAFAGNRLFPQRACRLGSTTAPVLRSRQCDFEPAPTELRPCAEVNERSRS